MTQTRRAPPSSQSPTLASVSPGRLSGEGTSTTRSVDIATESRFTISTVHQIALSQFLGTRCANLILPRDLSQVLLGRVSLPRSGRVQGLPSAHVGGASARREA